MGDNVRVPYPPCAYKPRCNWAECCFDGLVPSRLRWPELVGQNGEQAKTVIEKDNAYVTVVLTTVKKGEIDFCCNRVYVWIDLNGNVLEMPVVG
ncbi:hypothetical protein BT93_L3227 [Corymbia citriodora subsp. variegata]|uniref:Proteinase inhibitor n=1 Tax=Corymbia citriodora subsp. variegata TaxID=360336 RepID=A0A8T0CHW8_CORYI|nr:hypothetical protein BT93_L3227 [Corymbia citriodora subsp. variegata]